MAEFYIEKTAQENGEHLIHFSSCGLVKGIAAKDYLGSIASFESATIEALRTYRKTNACPACAAKYRKEADVVAETKLSDAA